MRKPGSISVVLPTYNCRSLLVRHLRSMQAWLDIVDEIVVVDSRSTDGTMDLIRSELNHPKLRLIERDRGLYQSWNEGIAATKGDWVYISTAGDTISREHLLLLWSRGEAAHADVVISPCRYVDETGQPLTSTSFRNPRIHREMSGRGAILIEPPMVRHLAFRSAGTHALMGSCASDLFRGDFIRERPFPTEYGTHGDTAWTLRHSSEIRLALVPECGSDFCVHTKEKTESRHDLLDILDRMFIEEIKRAGKTHGGGLSVAVRDAMRSRRLAKQQFGALSWAWALANLRYLGLRVCLGCVQGYSQMRLRSLVHPIERSKDAGSA